MIDDELLAEDCDCIYCGICCENDICVNCAEAMLESFLTRWGGDE